MQDLAGKTAIVTGAGSGIGLGMARAFAQVGMNVALCDIRKEPLARALAEVRGLAEGRGARAIAIETDVSERAAVERAAVAAEREFGRIHVACNNAGVAMHGVPIETLPAAEWDWVIGVNVYGVIHGIQTFVPRIRAHGEGGHVVNTASIGGFQVHPGWHTGAYSMTKYAVVALSEALDQDLAGSGIGVSVLCPAAVATHLPDTADSRPQRFGGGFTREANHFLRDAIKDGLAPEEVGWRVVEAIRGGEFFVFTHTEPRHWIEQRHRRIMEAMDAAERWKAARPARENKAPAKQRSRL
jgi:NAD(P)-dependent dehydrogenase (short-subunit alcohol dehydrogenase family)